MVGTGGASQSATDMSGDETRAIDRMYAALEQADLRLVSNCKIDTPFDLERAIRCNKSYLAHLVSREHNSCVMHECVAVFLGSHLDKRFRPNATLDGDVFGDAFLINGRTVSFPNIMMNNNILMHDFTGGLYEKGCRKLYVYGCANWGHGIQIVYDPLHDKMFIRDIRTKDFIVTDENTALLNGYLQEAIVNNQKWPELGELYPVNFDYISVFKMSMSVPLNYPIDNFANKLIFSPTDLMAVDFRGLLRKRQLKSDVPAPSEAKRRKRSGVLFTKESGDIQKRLTSGKLHKSISKTIELQTKFNMNQNFQDSSSKYNSDVLPLPLKHKYEGEVVRLMTKHVNSHALMQHEDYLGFVDFANHGEMTAAGKRFFLCSDVSLVNIDFERLRQRIRELEHLSLIKTPPPGRSPGRVRIMINDLPTNKFTKLQHVLKICFYLKSKRFQVELRRLPNPRVEGLHFLFINHHLGIVTKLVNGYEMTSYELNNPLSIVCNIPRFAKFKAAAPLESFLSKTTLHYMSPQLSLITKFPPSKVIVTLTNLKNSTPVIRSTSELANLKYCVNLFNNFILVDPSHYLNDRFFWLWTIVGDYHLRTTEDPFVPHIKLPFSVHSVRRVKIDGRFAGSFDDVKVELYNYPTDDGGSRRKSFFITDNDLIYVKFCRISVSKLNGEIDWNAKSTRVNIQHETLEHQHVYTMYIYMHNNVDFSSFKVETVVEVDKKTIFLNMFVTFQYANLTGAKLCGMGQKGVTNTAVDFSEWKADDNTCPQLMVSPISFIARQTTYCKSEFERKTVMYRGTPYTIFKIPYVLYNIMPDAIVNEFTSTVVTGNEKREGTRLDQYTIDNALVGNMQSNGIQFHKSISCDQIGEPQNMKQFRAIARTLNMEIRRKIF